MFVIDSIGLMMNLEHEEQHNVYDTCAVTVTCYSSTINDTVMPFYQ